MALTLTFLGAARTVTGSKYLLDTGSEEVLVDAGLFQGLKELRERNWQDLPIAPAEHRCDRADARAPRSCRLPAAPGRAGLPRPRLLHRRDAGSLPASCCPTPGRIQEEDAEHANRHGFSKHSPALPLYGEVDALRALTLLQPVGYDRPVPVAEGVEVEFINAGHLLGSAYARIKVEGLTMLFGGDLGRFDRPVLPDPTMVAEADYLLVESTYGDRVHDAHDDAAVLERIIKDTVGRGGRVIIPAFAIGRVEELLYWLKRLEEERRIPVLPVFVDSPMAIDALARYTERLRELDPEMQPEERDDKAPHGPAAHEKRGPPAPARAEGAAALRLLHRALPRPSGQPPNRRSSPARRCRPSSSRRAAWRPAAASCTTSGRAARRAQHGPVRRLPGRRHARPQPRRRREERQDPRPDRPGARAGRCRSTRCRRTPTRTRSCAGCAASNARRAPPSSSTASRRDAGARVRRSTQSSAGRRRSRSIGRR